MQAILNVAFPTFAVILVGYLAGRWRILWAETTGALNAFVSWFALPVLFFGTLARTPVAAVLDPVLMLGFGLVATFAAGMLTSRLVARGGLAPMSLQGIAASSGDDLALVPGKVALLMPALPTTANAFVLARQFDIAVKQSSASVLLSAAFSVITVSALLMLLRVS